MSLRTTKTRRRAQAGLTSAAMVAALAVLPAAPAHAEGISASALCLADTDPAAEQTITHSGTQAMSSFPDGANPPNAIRPGDVVKVTVTGTIRTDWAPWAQPVGPAGHAVPAPSDWPFPGFNQHALIARWNSSGVGWVGAPVLAVSLGGCTTAPSWDTRLLYYLNDNPLWDNLDRFTVRTQVFRAR